MSQYTEQERRPQGHPFYPADNRQARTAAHGARRAPTNPIWIADTHREWEKYLHAGQCYKFRTRDYLPQFQQGEQGFYFLRHGRARVVCADGQYKGTPLHYYGPGTLLYELSPAREQFPCQIYAVTPVEAYFYPLAQVLSESFAQRHPQLLISALTGHVSKLNHYLRRLASIIEGKAFANVCRLFLELSRSNNNARDLALGITQEELATLLCVRRCWLGKILRRLKDENVIGRCTKSRLVIEDMDKLTQYAAS